MQKRRTTQRSCIEAVKAREVAGVMDCLQNLRKQFSNSYARWGQFLFASSVLYNMGIRRRGVSILGVVTKSSLFYKIFASFCKCSVSARAGERNRHN